MLQSYDMNINYFVLLPLCFAIFIFYAYYFMDRDTKNLEFRVAIRMSYSPIGVAIFIFIQATLFQNSILSALFIFPMVLIITLSSLNFATRKMKHQTNQINKNTGNLERIIETSSENSLTVANIATELAASASEVNASSEEISSTTLEINKMAQDQVKELETMHKMANDIKNIASVITSISEQTNLLALNASIEAGRAGEYGRGFAVVAEKVQKLAEESKHSVDETGNIIEIINNNISKLTDHSKKLSIIIEGISASAEEQTASMEEITSTASRLGDLSEGLKQNLLRFKPSKYK